MLFKNNHAMRTVFNALYEGNYQLQKRKDDSFFVILPNNWKIEIWDNGNDCICVGSWNETYDYQQSLKEMAEKVLNHIETLFIKSVDK